MQRKRNVFVFQPGKYYKHSGGGMLHCLHFLRTKMYGVTLIAEDDEGRFRAVGSSSDNTVNYVEITEEEYNSNFSK